VKQLMDGYVSSNDEISHAVYVERNCHYQRNHLIAPYMLIKKAWGLAINKGLFMCDRTTALESILVFFFRLFARENFW
jgi:hypothetical protein